MKLVIDRKLWIRGYDASTASALMVRDGRMCCLGFYSIACGIKKEEIDPTQTATQRMISYPVDIVNKKIRETLPESMKWLLYEDRVVNEKGKVINKRITNSADAAALARANDGRANSEEEREKQIIELFAKHDVQVEFIN